MPINGMSREYNWEDIICLILKDVGLDPEDRRYHDLWYLGSFVIPKSSKDPCIRVTKYEMDFNARLDENVRDKL